MEKKKSWKDNLLKFCLGCYLDGKKLSIDMHFSQSEDGEIECKADASFSAEKKEPLHE